MSERDRDRCEEEEEARLAYHESEAKRHAEIAANLRARRVNRCVLCGQAADRRAVLLEQARRERDELGEAARLNAEAAAEWEREYRRSEARARRIQDALFRRRNQRDSARDIARLYRDAFLHTWDKTGSWPKFLNDEELTQRNVWLTDPGALDEPDPSPSAPRCVLCGHEKPRLDPAGVCQACRIGKVVPAGEE